MKHLRNTLKLISTAYIIWLVILFSEGNKINYSHLRKVYNYINSNHYNCIFEYSDESSAAPAE